MKVVSKLPKTENGHGVHCKTSKEEYLITQSLEKMKFTLWRIVDGGYEQVSTSKSPIDLYHKIPW